MAYHATIVDSDGLKAAIVSAVVGYSLLQGVEGKSGGGEVEDWK